MRLVCPNCGAQYEVDDRVIPDSGRDVQCSACGHGWYQMPIGRETEADDLDLAADDQLVKASADEMSDDLAGQGVEVEYDETAPEPDDEDIEDEDDEEPIAPAPAAAHAARPRVVDDGIRSILREEAERELSARAAETRHEPQKVETQPELGLEAGPSPEEQRRRIARERMARMRGMDADEMPEPDFDGHAEIPEEPAKPAQGRDLFPDIEEINSTLDSHAPGLETGADLAELQPALRGGFRRGFSLMIALAAILLAVYLVAPRLAAGVPALEPVLAAYVEAVNQGRAWLDETLRGLIARIEAAAGGSG